MSIHELECSSETEGDHLQSRGCTAEELIDLTVGPYHINHKLLHAVLKAFAISITNDIKFEIDLNDNCSPVPLKICEINCMERFPDIEILEGSQNEESFEPERIFKLPESALTVNKRDCITLIQLRDRICKLEDASTKYCERINSLQKNQEALCWETKHINKRIGDMEPQISNINRRVNSLDKQLYKLKNCCDTATENFKEVNRSLRIAVAEIDTIKRVNFFIQNELNDVKDCYHSLKQQIIELQERTEVVRKIREIIQDIDQIKEWKLNFQREFDIMTERYEYLKMTKVNRADHDNELALKADKVDLQFYTELKYFELMYKKIKTNLEELTNRFNNSTQCLHNNIIDIQSILKSKTDKCDLKRLKQQIESDLIVLNKKVNDLISNRLFSYASAVKTDTLWNVNCLTCTSYAKLNEVEQPLPKLPELLGPLGRQRYVGGSHTRINCHARKSTKMRGHLKAFISNRNASCKITK